MGTGRALSCLYGGCAGNGIVVEAISKVDKNAGTLLNLCRYTVMAVYQAYVCFAANARNPKEKGIVQTFREPTMPLWYHGVQAALSVGANQCTLLCYAFHVSHPLQVLVRSSSPLATLLVGHLLFGERYGTLEVLSVALLSFGVFIATYADAAFQVPGSHLFLWIFGVFLLFLGTIMTASLTHMQAYGFRRWGHAWKEGLLIQNILVLPMFLPAVGDLWSRASLWNESRPLNLLQVFGLETYKMEVPLAWVLVCLDAVTQTICIQGVLETVSNFGGLGSTIAMSFRKFISLVLSIIIFGNIATWKHYVGAVFVITGTGLHSVARSTKSKGKGGKKD